jgi:chemotaxis protein CheC
MSEVSTGLRRSDVERLRQLVGVAAGHATSALAGLLARPCRMRPPVAYVVGRGASGPHPWLGRDRSDREVAGVFFELAGGLEGVLVMLLPREGRDELLRHLVGKAPQDVSEETVESVLRELGNILVSHVASALGNMLGVTVVPSVPLLVPEDAESALAALSRPDRPAVLVESEIFVQRGPLRARLVFVPADPAAIAGDPGF